MNINENQFEVERSNNKSKSILIVVLLLMIVGVIIAACLYKQPEKEKKVIESKVDMTLAKALYLDDVIAGVKDYYYRNNLIEENNLEYWNIQNSELIGYYEESTDTKIYSVQGEYKCLDGTGSCVYLEQIGDMNSNGTYPFKIYAEINVDTEPYKVKGIMGALVTNGLVEDKSIISKVNEELENNIISSLKNKMIESSLYDESKVNSIVLNAEYEKNVDGKNYYHIYGNYNCTDQSSDCFYQSQVETIKNGMYPISLFVVGETNGNEFVLERIDDCMVERPSDDVIENEPATDVLSDQEIFELLKSYYRDKNLSTESDIDEWVLVNVSLSNSNTYKVVSKYKCLSSDSTCVYVSQVDDPDSDGYISFEVTVVVDKENEKYFVKSVE